MVVCPNCGAKFSAAHPSTPPMTTEKGEGNPQVAVQLVKCPMCETRFLAKTRITPLRTANVKNGIERIRTIEDELMQTLKALREKIQALEAERAVLLEEIEKLKTAAESRASALEGEVGQMREEVKSLKELLGSNEKQAEPSVQNPNSA
jgi:uncharacterized Zn finger protein (UPF0148 family)